MKTKVKTFKKSVKRVVIVFRPESDRAKSLAGEVVDWLKSKKISVFSHPLQSLGPEVPHLSTRDHSRLDLAIVLGGDGTYLEAVRLLKGAQIPILGFNLGSLGFLTVSRAEDTLRVLDATLKGKMLIRHRSLIKVRVKRAGKTRLKLTALNDVVIERGPLSQLINISMYINDQLMSEIKADGLIIASPTGSTAYNLAAGGPILHPEVRALVITSICPHSLTNRPLVCPDSEAVQFRLNDRSQKAILTIDGRKAAEISFHDEVIIERAELEHTVLRRPTDNFFSLLKDKLKFGERA